MVPYQTKILTPLLNVLMLCRRFRSQINFLSSKPSWQLHFVNQLKFWISLSEILLKTITFFNFEKGIRNKLFENTYIKTFWTNKNSWNRINKLYINQVSQMVTKSNWLFEKHKNSETFNIVVFITPKNIFNFEKGFRSKLFKNIY